MPASAPRLHRHSSRYDSRRTARSARTVRVYCPPRTRVEGPDSRAEDSPPTMRPRAPATRRWAKLARLAPSIACRARGAPKVRPLHHYCRPGRRRTPCVWARCERVPKAAASRFRGRTHQRATDGAIPTYSSAKTGDYATRNPFCNRKNEILIHTKHAIFPSPEIGGNQNFAHGFSGTMITD